MTLIDPNKIHKGRVRVLDNKVRVPRAESPTTVKATEEEMAQRLVAEVTKARPGELTLTREQYTLLKKTLDEDPDLRENLNQLLKKVDVEK